jgi:hypothetical protein
MAELRPHSRPVSNFMQSRGGSLRWRRYSPIALISGYQGIFSDGVRNKAFAGKRRPARACGHPGNLPALPWHRPCPRTRAATYLQSLRGNGAGHRRGRSQDRLILVAGRLLRLLFAVFAGGLYGRRHFGTTRLARPSFCNLPRGG